MQPPIKVAIQGDRASFHEIAAYKYYQQPIELIYCQSFEQVFEQLKSESVDNGFVAVCNSSHGGISEVEALIAATNPTIEGEYLLPIEQHIIGLPDTDLNEVTTVISHPVALSQCSIHIQRNFNDVDVRNYHDTSAAVEYVKYLADSSIVAIASEAAAKLHGLIILDRAIQNDPDNATLFKSLSMR